MEGMRWKRAPPIEVYNMELESISTWCPRCGVNQHTIKHWYTFTPFTLKLTPNTGQLSCRCLFRVEVTESPVIHLPCSCTPQRSRLQFSPLQMLRATAPTISSGMMRLLQEDNNSDDDQPTSQQNKSRRVHAAYLCEMKNAHSEGRLLCHIIQTSKQGIIINLHTKWHGAVKSLAQLEIDYKKNYNDHPLAWSIVVGKIQRKLNKTFIF
jgi:hypothetical protein